MKDYLKVLGCRGSVPRSGEAFAKYGGATTSYALRLGGRLIIVDAGSGILDIDSVLEGETRVDLFLTHPHADHILGLPMCRPAFRQDFRFDIYAKTRAGLNGKAQINAFLKLPNWPVDIDGLGADFCFHELPEDFILEGGAPVRVRSMEAAHPGGSSLLRFEYEDKSVVIATDCTIKINNADSMARFASDCGLLLIDGQYRPIEAGGREGFGHNSWALAAEFGERCGAKRTLIVHHDPYNTDDILDAAAEDIRALSASASPAFEGEIIEL
jgi:phosphoribosyl 1,2-cyclic phosphodiesterase